MDTGWTDRSHAANTELLCFTIVRILFKVVVQKESHQSCDCLFSDMAAVSVSQLIICSHFTGGLDLILMPGLGFDRLGKRLGRGKGFYDTYLERCIRHPKGKPYTIALAFKEQLCQEIPVDDNDVLIDEILYEDDE